MLQAGWSARWVAVALASGAIACERKVSTPGNDSAASVAPPPAESPGGVPVASAWRDRDGPFLVTATDNAHTVSLVAPDSAGMPDGRALSGAVRAANASIALIGRSGLIARATLQASTVVQRRDCEWPQAALVAGDSLGEEVRWGVGFAGAVAAPVALDSLERSTRADSARLVADIARLASALPDDTMPGFRGIPFVVRNAWRFEPVPDRFAMVAEISRRVAQEANQREERLLLVAERDSATGRWQPRWWARAQGTEETVETLDALALVMLGGDAWPSLVVGHDAPAGTWQEIVARTSTGAWQRRWRSGVSGACS